jgi:tRNA 2-selenouridine synthase
MPIEKINIERFMAFAKDHPVIDVRSPAEFIHAHIPGAKPLPLFTDEERKIVGTTYKQESREAAIKIGLDFFGPKMKGMVEQVEALVRSRQSAISNQSNVLPTANCLLIYCWRGGMRSAGVAWLMDLYGFKVYTLAGGYKKFRNYVLDTFRFPYQFNILGGYTGSGKTELLRSLERNGEIVVDLEKVAGHKGSAFGNIGLPKQPTQEMFENFLALELQKALVTNVDASFPFQHPPIWLEDESQRIGDVNIPHELWNTMRRSPVFFLDIPFEERLKYITEGYGKHNREELINSIERIRERLGGLEAKKAIDFLNANTIIESFRILLKYYDKWYFKSLHNRENINSLLTIISHEKVDPKDTGLLLRHANHQKTANV